MFDGVFVRGEGGAFSVCVYHRGKGGYQISGISKVSTQLDGKRLKGVFERWGRGGGYPSASA